MHERMCCPCTACRHFISHAQSKFPELTRDSNGFESTLRPARRTPWTWRRRTPCECSRELRWRREPRRRRCESLSQSSNPPEEQFERDKLPICNDGTVERTINEKAMKHKSKLTDKPASKQTKENPTSFLKPRRCRLLCAPGVLR